MNKLVAVAQLSVCFVLLFCISGSGQTRPAELVGNWKITSRDTEVLDLKSDGTGRKSGAETPEDFRDKTNYYSNNIKWKVENGNLVITDENGTSKLRGKYINGRSGKSLSDVVKSCNDGRPAELVGYWEWKSEDYEILEFKSDGKGIRIGVYHGVSYRKDFKWDVEYKPVFVMISNNSEKWRRDYSIKYGKTLNFDDALYAEEYEKISK